MSIVKGIEVIASTEKSIDNAVRMVVVETSKTIHTIDSVYQCSRKRYANQFVRRYLQNIFPRGFRVAVAFSSLSVISESPLRMASYV